MHPFISCRVFLPLMPFPSLYVPTWSADSNSDRSLSTTVTYLISSYQIAVQLFRRTSPWYFSCTLREYSPVLPNPYNFGFVPTILAREQYPTLSWDDEQLWLEFSNWTSWFASTSLMVLLPQLREVLTTKLVFRWSASHECHIHCFPILTRSQAWKLQWSSGFIPGATNKYIEALFPHLTV